MINPTTFVLMVIIGTSPPQQRGEFHSYHQCYQAAQGEVANLGPDVRWDCVPKSSVEGHAWTAALGAWALVVQGNP